ncbi:hypothetical protein KZX46_11125 [Polymorphobacter sp. PAMC 29334]|uniref:hypothetical protein n=1 Tax=Polymorphobacter sp. PAMC 29334 TaxID=2862331 RepID=UPI001C75C62F|nr:hypothetical protein [Polymorphobacter sp. PAMC 29334]QYE36417.1 hypothetical protein KZX46_11125 [Polymorphobacter sp. PAMC 29334]
MKLPIILMTAFIAVAATAQTAPPVAPLPHSGETPTERGQRLANDRAHSTAHANETPAQRSSRLAADRARRLAAERAEKPTAADAAGDRQRLAADETRALAKRSATETPAERSQRLAADKARGEAKKHHPA